MTPIEGFKGNFLDVTDAEGNKIPYTGAMVKRGKPSRSAFVHLAPQASIVAEFNLLDAYPIRQAGTYRIQFKGNASMNGLPDSNVLEIIVGE
jgi:peptidyl-Lys metalloendopeptidase